MSAEVSQVSVVIRGDDQDAEKKIKGINDRVEKAGGFFKNALSNALGFASGAAIVAGVGGAVAFVTSNLGDMVRSGAEANRINDVLAQGLKTTGGASGQTAKSLDDLSGAIMRQTGIDDDSVKSAEQMLLTFTGLGKTVFPLATQAAADMATRMNGGAIPSAQQMQQQALLLGKALNDPTKGLTALTREGVTFTDEQKKQIKAMQDAGDTAGVQKIILAELNKEFGGSAAAAGQANGGIAILTANFDNMKQTVGQAIIPILVGLMQALQPITSALSQALPGAIAVVTGWFDQWGPLLQITWNYLTYVAQALGQALMPALKALLGPLAGAKGGGDLFHTILQKLGSFIPTLNGFLFNLQGAISANSGPFAALHSIAQAVGNFFWNTLIPTLQTLAGFVISDVVPAVQKFATFVAENVLPTVITFAGFIATNVVPIVLNLAHIFIQNVLPALQQVWTSISQNLIPSVEKLWSKISPVLIPAMQFLGWLLQNVVGPALGLLLNLIGHGIDLLANIIGKVGDFIGRLGDLAGKIGNAKDKFGDFLGVLGHIKDVLWDIIQRIGDLIAKIGQIHLPDLSGLHVPGFASGTDDAPGGLAYVHKDELIYLPQHSVVKTAAQTANLFGAPAVSSASGGGGGGTTQHIIFQLDGRTLAEATVKEMPNVVRLGTGIKAW